MSLLHDSPDDSDPQLEDPANAPDKVNSQAEEKRLEPVRFDLVSLFILTLVCAGGIALVREFDLGGVVIMFMASVIATVMMWYFDDLPTKQFWLQAVWGILMPMVCLLMDPILFRDDIVYGDGDPTPFSVASISPVAVATYGFVAWQMAMLTASWILKPTCTRWAAFLAGNLFAGCAVAGAIGALLFLPAVMFSIFLLGLPGFTPLFTMNIYLRAYRYCLQVAGANSNSRVLWTITGCAVALLVGFLAGATWGIVRDAYGPTSSI